MHSTRQLALIPFRDTVLFPGSELPIFVGREATIKAIKFAKKENDGDIAVFSQTKAENPGPIGASDIYQIGTMAKLAASVEMTDQSIKGMLEGRERVRLENLKVVDGVTLVSVRSEPEAAGTDQIDLSFQKDILAMLFAWEPKFDRGIEKAEVETIRSSRDLVSIVTALRTLIASPRIDNAEIRRKWDLGKNPAPPRYQELRNNAVALRQRVLEAGSNEQKLTLLREAIQFDLNCRSEEFS